MINQKYLKLIEKEFGDTVRQTRLLAETYPSRIYDISGERRYILKETKEFPLNRQFDCHKKLFSVWSQNQSHLGFKIPAPYLLSPDGAFMLMEYIEGTNLLNLLLDKQKNIPDLFYRTGQALRQFQEMAQDTLADVAVDLRECDSIQAILTGPKGSVVGQILNHFSPEQCGIIYKDFTATNIVIDANDGIYFIDVQDCFYRAPLAYDLARFIDTTRVFSLVRKPSMLWSFHLVKQAERSFLEGYGKTTDEEFRKAQFVDRTEHIYIKSTKTPFRGFILRLLYSII